MGDGVGVKRTVEHQGEAKTPTQRSLTFETPNSRPTADAMHQFAESSVRYFPARLFGPLRSAVLSKRPPWAASGAPNDRNGYNSRMTRDQAIHLLREYVVSESLIRHALAVEASMRAYARHLNEDEERWGLVGLLHDFDYERWPEPPHHTREGAIILRGLGVDEEIIEAILPHAEWNEIPRDTPLKKALFAVDELSGFITAVAYVRSTRSLMDVDARSVRKKMKDKAFARAVRREDITGGAELLEVDLDEHIERCIAALRGVRGELGL